MTTESKAPVVELWPIGKLVPYEANAKKHPKEQVKILAASIKRLGWTQPILVDGKGVIIAGHGRRLAAIELGLKKVPVLCKRDLTEVEANALRLADNRVVSTDYDTELLKIELAALNGFDFDLSLLGFDDKELSFLSDIVTDMDESMFVTDIHEAVEGRKEENIKEVIALDESAAPLADAFGFRRLTVSQSRRVRAFMTKIEAETSKQGPDALMVFFDNLGV